MLMMRNDVECIVEYLAALVSGHPVALIDPGTQHDVIDMLVGTYLPGALLQFDHDVDGYRRDGAEPVRARHPSANAPRPFCPARHLGLDGEPEVCAAVDGGGRSNAASIAEGLGIEGSDIAPADLPLHYSYGLSVLNSHLYAGATVVPTEYSFVQREFWELFDRCGCTSLAGGALLISDVASAAVRPVRSPSLRMLTQAGGRLAESLVAEFHQRSSEAGVGFAVMYGQTEATARMAILPPGDLPERLGSAGRAIPGGRFEIIENEVVYEGPNVMLGYAREAADLALGDDCHGRLYTGDLGELDDDGYLRLTGRAKRIGKVFGTRVSLDDVEDLVSQFGHSASIASDDKVIIFVDGLGEHDARHIAATVAQRFRLPISGFDVRVVESLPRRANGKTDYAALERA